MRRLPACPYFAIHTDGSWLSANEHNPAETGGWAVVIIFHIAPGVPPQRWQISGPAGAAVKSSGAAEAFAALKGLEEAKRLRREWLDRHPEAAGAEMVLYTDSVALRDALNRFSQDPDRVKPFFPFSEELRALVKDMPFTAKQAGASARQAQSPAARIDEADALANSAAWLSRLERQGYIAAGRQRLEGADAVAAIAFQVSQRKNRSR